MRPSSAAATTSRRRFLQTAAAAGAAAIGSPRTAWADGFGSALERPVVAFVGLGIRYGGLMMESLPFGPCAALCDVDSGHLKRGAEHLGEAFTSRGLSMIPPAMYSDYRRILDRDDIDAVVIATPDHWHTKMAVEALLAGKDVYCEKPLTLTIAEGQQILDALGRTNAVMQVGTQQRSGRDFQTAAALARDGRMGAMKRVTCGINGSPGSGQLPVTAPPAELDWDRWLGPAPWAEYRAASELPEYGYGNEYPYSRAHAHFRWWYEYAGGKLTDWGAHHVDIAMWALNKSDGNVGPYTVEPVRSNHPVEFEDGYPVQDDRFNVALTFDVKVTFEDGVELRIVDDAGELGFDNGVMFECENGRYFVNRGKLTGAPVEALQEDPLPDDALTSLGVDFTQAGEGSHEARSASHMENFFRCVKSRETPVSDVASHHRHLTVCHAANIALRLDRTLTFDPATERFIGDDQANKFLARESRKGYEIEA